MKSHHPSKRITHLHVRIYSIHTHFKVFVNDLKEYFKVRKSKGIIKDHLFLNNRNEKYYSGETINDSIKETAQQIADELSA